MVRGFLIYSLSLFSALCFLIPQPAFVKMAIQKKRPGCVFGVSSGLFFFLRLNFDVLNWRRCIPHW